MKKLALFVIASFLGLNVWAQETTPFPKAKNRVSFNLVSHRVLTSTTYTRLMKPFNNELWTVGFGIGFGTGSYLGSSEAGRIGDNALPVFGLIEYGVKHQIGLRLGYTYYFDLRKIDDTFLQPPFEELTSFIDYHGFNSALYYRYHFGANQKYFLGTGVEFIYQFGEVYNTEIRDNTAILPNLSIGFQF